MKNSQKTYAMLTLAVSLTAIAPGQTPSWYVYRIQPVSQNGVPTNTWLTDWNTDFGSDAGKTYFPNGFASGDATTLGTTVASPIAVFGGAKVRLNVGLYFYNRHDLTYTARGFLGNNQITIPDLQATYDEMDHFV